MKRMSRARLSAGFALAMTIACGLGVRAFMEGWWSKNLGVVLWAVAAYCLLRLVPARRGDGGVWIAAAGALALSWGVELAQLSAVPRTISSWHPVLRLIFGEVFAASDLVALVIGVALAACGEAAIQSPRRSNPKQSHPQS